MQIKSQIFSQSTLRITMQISIKLYHHGQFKSSLLIYFKDSFGNNQIKSQISHLVSMTLVQTLIAPKLV